MGIHPGKEGGYRCLPHTSGGMWGVASATTLNKTTRGGEKARTTSGWCWREPTRGEKRRGDQLSVNTPRFKAYN